MGVWGVGYSVRGGGVCGLEVLFLVVRVHDVCVRVLGLCCVWVVCVCLPACRVRGWMWVCGHVAMLPWRGLCVCGVACQ
jgi:hypothetical protein